MDIEWGRDGVDGKLYILQARPETVKASEQVDTLAALPLEGALRDPGVRRAIGQRVGIGPGAAGAWTRARWTACKPGDVLVTDMTDPDWEPVMKTRRGHRHQPRRAHLSCGDHRARARHSRGRRLRRRDRAC